MDKANFDFLEKIPELASFYHYCHEAEIFALSYPDLSVTSSRKAMEYMVKLLYGSAINENLKEMTVFDMLADPDFVIYMDDRALLGAFHFIRKKGNMAVHQGRHVPRGSNGDAGTTAFSGRRDGYPAEPDQRLSGF